MNKEQELKRKKSPVSIKNKKASFEYFFVETYTAGIVLTGTEIKSIRLGKASLVDTFCYINNHEVWVKGMNISPYFYGSFSNHEARRDRKLLLTKTSSRMQPSSLATPLCLRLCLSTNMDVPRWTLLCAEARKSMTSDRR